MKRRSYLTATLGGIAGINLGGATWSGGAFDPTLGYYISNTTDSGEIGPNRAPD